MNFKKLGATVVAAAMLLSANVFAAPADLAGAGIDEQAGLLGALGIMVGDDDGNFRPNDTIKRSEFAKIAVATLGMTDDAASNKNISVFDDVPTWHWANGYIAVASQRGIFIGDENGNYRPDDNVSYAEAMTVFVRMLGYGKSADDKGPWPNGHMSVGTQIGLTKDMANNSPSSSLVRLNAAKMNYNALTIEMMEQTGFGSNELYEITDKTLLGEKLNVTKSSGQISANHYTTLDGESTLKKDEVKIGDKIYKAVDTSAKQLIGYNVNYYWRENSRSDKDEVIYVSVNKNTNKTVSVDGKNIVSADQNGEKITFKYWLDKQADSSPKEINISNDAKLIYNEKATALSLDYLKPSNGTVTLIDTNSDSKYDVINVSEYVDYVVDDISKNTYTVSDKYGNKPLKLDPENDDVEYQISDKNGETVYFEDLEEWNVLSVSRSLDEKLIKITVSTDSVSGKITGIGENGVEINDKEYKVSSSYPYELKIEDEATFYLDVDGKIAGVDSEAAMSTNYAYLIKAATKDTINPSLEVKLFDKTGKTVILSAADRLQINSKTVKNEEALGILNAPQMITYSANAGGKIVKITTSADKTSAGGYHREFSKDFSGEDIIFNELSSKLGKYVVNEKTLIIDIGSGSDEDSFTLRDMSAFVNGGKYSADIYDVNEDLSASVVVLKGNNADIYSDANIAIIDKITKVQNDRGEIVQRASVYFGGEKIYLTESESGVFEKNSKPLVSGDIISFTKNAKGEVDSIKLLLNIDNKETEFETRNEKSTFVNGRVIKKFTNSVNVSVNGGEIESYSLNDVIVYKYDETKNSKISLASPADIEKYNEENPQTLFIRIFDSKVKEMVIID